MKVEDQVRAALGAGRHTLTEPEAKVLFKSLGIPVPDGGVANSAEDAADLARKIGLPVVAKVVSPDITHKTEAGGVVCPVAMAEDAAEAYEAIVGRVRGTCPEASIEGVLIEAFRPGGIECVVGIKRDEAFGPVVMFGLGGVFVEVLDEVAFRLAPLTDGDVEAMLSETRGSRCLDGFRGQPAVDKAALAAVIKACAGIATAPGVGKLIGTLEINPLTASENGVVALDGLVTLRP
ncbi:MAG: acetate--CoA ligase family protein [Rhodospirillales bacterium]|jgi:acetyl-CoA synthetase (ADP-forming)|nr:acetate--CoA ligase family protein [Rhodospirillales bacterium]HJO71627.1 acetate--CoA ligase family protein [Rhodospirillales bacterium]